MGGVINESREHRDRSLSAVEQRAESREGQGLEIKIDQETKKDGGRVELRLGTDWLSFQL